MPTGAGRAAAVLAALCAGLALGGCAGVPRSSSPEVIDTVGVAQPQQPAIIAPPKDANPREIVQYFLQGNAASDEHHAGARDYLTPEEKNRWSDTAGAAILDNTHVGLFNDRTSSLTVSGHLIGTLDQNGVYSPNPAGDGVASHGAQFTETIGLKRVKGQWRISSLQNNGLLITQNQFKLYYTPREIYFYDAGDAQLVPSLRYTPLTDPAALSTWLMGQLAAGPAASASTSSLSTNLPSAPNASQVKVRVGKRIVVDLPGASQLDPDTKNQMAAQVGLTVGQAAPNTPVQITDASRPVTIPRLGTSAFDPDVFGASLQPSTITPELYFVYHGAVYDESGKALPGGAGTGSYGLTSVALATVPGTSRLRVAGVAGSGSGARLFTGQSGGALHQTSVRGSLSRPAWAPGRDEVWIGNGTALYRVANGKASKVAVSLASGTVSGNIIAVRLSPEGARIALVIAASGHTSQIWIGFVARTSSSVRVTGLHSISPPGVTITDVAWNDLRKLYAVGQDKSSGDPSVYTVECDGSFWTAPGIGNLPQGPDSITVAKNGVPVVSAESRIWVQANGTWVSPEAGTTYGRNPIYAE